LLLQVRVALTDIPRVFKQTVETSSGLLICPVNGFNKAVIVVILFNPPALMVYRLQVRLAFKEIPRVSKQAVEMSRVLIL
jgi:hypothetical protein